VPQKNSDMIASRMSEAEVVMIEGGGHGVIYQFPEEFSRIVLDFFRAE